MQEKVLVEGLPLTLVPKVSSARRRVGRRVIRLIDMRVNFSFPLASCFLGQCDEEINSDALAQDHFQIEDILIPVAVA